MEYLDFELPIKELLDQLESTIKIGKETNTSVAELKREIELKLKLKKKEIYKNLSPWQIVQLSRHPDRPYTLDYIDGALFGKYFFDTQLWLVNRRTQVDPLQQ